MFDSINAQINARRFACFLFAVILLTALVAQGNLVEAKQIAAMAPAADASGEKAPATTTGAAASTSATSATPQVAAPATSAPGPSTSTAGGEPAAVPKVLLKPGQPLVLQESTEDLQPTDDVNLAKEQVDAYADSPEAHFIYAVALTRTSRVEDALREVRTARRLAMAKGGYSYFDSMIKSYEELLANVPDDNRIRYGLAWAYYMKAYLLTRIQKEQTKLSPVRTQRKQRVNRLTRWPMADWDSQRKQRRKRSTTT